MKTYKAKSLFTGYKIGLVNSNLYVGVPGKQSYPHKENFEDEKNFEVIYMDKKMKIRSWKKAQAYHTFDDFQGRGTYTLAYFQWKPIIEPEQISVFGVMDKMVGTPEWEKTRELLHKGGENYEPK